MSSGLYLTGMDDATLPTAALEELDDTLCDGGYQDSDCRFCRRALDILRHAIGDERLLRLIHGDDACRYDR